MTGPRPVRWEVTYRDEHSRRSRLVGSWTSEPTARRRYLDAWRAGSSSRRRVLVRLVGISARGIRLPVEERRNYL